MVRLPEVLHLVLLAALMAMLCEHILAVQDPFAPSQLQQFSYKGRAGAVHIIKDAVALGQASGATVQAAFDRRAGGVDGFPQRSLLRRIHKGKHARSLFPRCPKCRIGHCIFRKKYFTCRRRVGGREHYTIDDMEEPGKEAPGNGAPGKGAPGKEAPDKQAAG